MTVILTYYFEVRQCLPGTDLSSDQNSGLGTYMYIVLMKQLIVVFRKSQLYLLRKATIVLLEMKEADVGFMRQGR